MARIMNASVLIIDNDPPTLELYRRELSRDFRVLACQDETEALKLAAAEQVCAVVLEPAISGGDGWHLVQALQHVFGVRKVPIILCSTQDERRRGMDEGVAAFLVKPVLPFELRQTLRKFVR